ncbi:MAG: hypothetical protein JW741_12350 [Sedimentisphaerales bacterium]|nr:hypothetical protein [Sedimentisphaerales bacterium]
MRQRIATLKPELDSMEPSKSIAVISRMLVPGLVVLVLLSATAGATEYNWLTDGGNWSDASNWDPVGLPVSNDTAVVGNGITAITCEAWPDAGGYPHPDAVIVRANATIAPNDDLGTVRKQYFVIESGAHLDASDYLNVGWNALMHDNTRITLSHATGDTGDTITLDGGIVVTNTQYFSKPKQNFEGNGTVNVTIGTNLLWFVNGGFRFCGSVDMPSGDLLMSNGTRLGTGTNSFTLHMGPDTTCELKWRYNHGVYAGSTFNGTQHLVLDGTGEHAARVMYTDVKRDFTGSNPEILNTAIFGGEAVPPGTYTIGVDYTDYLVNTTTKSVELQILNEAVVDVPAKATMIVVR